MCKTSSAPKNGVEIQATAAVSAAAQPVVVQPAVAQPVVVQPAAVAVEMQPAQPAVMKGRFDPNTGQELPKFDPQTGQQNW